MAVSRGITEMAAADQLGARGEIEIGFSGPSIMASDAMILQNPPDLHFEQGQSGFHLLRVLGAHRV